MPVKAHGNAALLGDDAADADFLAAQAQAQEGEQVPDGARRVAVAVLKLVLDALDVLGLADGGQLLVHQNPLGLGRHVDARDERVQRQGDVGQLELALHRLALHLVDGLRQKLRVEVKAHGGDRAGLGRA